MKPFRMFIAAWILAGIGAVFGSILGHGVGKGGGGGGLFVGAIVGGIVGVVLAVVAGSRFHWLAPEDRTGGLVGGIIGFAIAAPIAASNLRTPIIPVLVCALAGVGVLLGAGVARGWRQSS